jgi:hypothetical protein
LEVAASKAREVTDRALDAVRSLRLYAGGPNWWVSVAEVAVIGN